MFWAPPFGGELPHVFRACSATLSRGNAGVRSLVSHLSLFKRQLNPCRYQPAK